VDRVRAVSEVQCGRRSPGDEGKPEQEFEGSMGIRYIKTDDRKKQIRELK